ncbi:hypothetical protein F4677DRAFT_437377 [Hypoxylon crocopeplum]|nr:hypothetical protein F4677DRAFT_437377 [Hypoxylon crocopeplum]
MGAIGVSALGKRGFGGPNSIRTVASSISSPSKLFLSLTIHALSSIHPFYPSLILSIVMEIKFQPRFDASAYQKAKGRSQEPKKFSSQCPVPFTSKFRSSNGTVSHESPPPIEEIFRRPETVTGQPRTPGDQQESAIPQYSTENKDGNQSTHLHKSSVGLRGADDTQQTSLPGDGKDDEEPGAGSGTINRPEKSCVNPLAKLPSLQATSLGNTLARDEQLPTTHWVGPVSEQVSTVSTDEWDAKIIGEESDTYLVAWEPTFIPKRNASKELIQAWKAQKAKMNVSKGAMGRVAQGKVAKKAIGGKGVRGRPRKRQA